MILPDWPMVRITRRKETVQSRGINYSDNYGEGDLACSENLSVRRWPFIASRNARKRVEQYQGVTALTSWSGLVTIARGDPEIRSKLKGKKISILGDSIDTFNAAGYKIDGYLMYYPSIDVLDVNDTWWMTVINSAEAVFEKNASFSGSFAVTYPQHSERPNFYSRVSLLGQPDVIFVALGVNDARNHVDLGEYDFESDYITLSEAEFRPAYIKGIKALQATYPDALIICAAKIMGDAYKESIRHIASVLDVDFIDVSDYLPEVTVHPGKKGMGQIADTILAAYKEEAQRDELKYKNDHVGWLDVTDEPRQFAAVNTKLVIWPDKIYLDMSTEPASVKKLGATLEATGATVAVTEVEKSGKVSMTTTITFTTDKDLTTMFHPGDGVELAGFSHAENNRSLVIKAVEAKKITVDSGDFKNETKSGTVTMERKIPEMDFICESGNRLWGVSNAEKTIYSSSLGDPTNFYVFQGVSTDSYALPVASAGDFTGCCKLSSSVLFWKEQVLHKVLGNYPAEYVMYTYEMEGVRAGCEKSMTIINDALFYVGLHGVFTYAGGTPADISAVFGEHMLTEAVGGTDGEKYYLSCLDDGKEAMYVFSPNDGVWLREDTFRAVDIAREGEDVYLLRRDGSVWIADSREPDPQIEWSLEYKPYFETIEGRKQVSRLLIRMEMPQGAWLRVETSTDDEPWQKAGLIKGPRADTVPLQIQPRRGDQYKVRLRGHGPCVIKGVLREYLQGGYQGGYD